LLKRHQLQNISTDLKKIKIIAFYKFVHLSELESLKEQLLLKAKQLRLMGLILLAHEGINSTLSGLCEDIDAFKESLTALEPFSDLEFKESFADEFPYHRMKVRIRKEIVTMGFETIKPTEITGEYVEAEQWNRLIEDPEVVLIDTRNDYEFELGTFKNAINPNIKKFSDLPQWIEENKSELNLKNKKIAMFCTGGIRCEKSTAYMKINGYENVYHLKGGILKYLEDVPEQQSLWQGECFVFDDRVSVKHDLTPSGKELCRCCREPLLNGYTESETFELGVSCPRCFDQTTPEQKARARERQRQYLLAQGANYTHIGDPH
jgi:UPF0176 protein